MSLFRRVCSGIRIALLLLAAVQTSSGAPSFPRPEQDPQQPQIQHEVRVVNIEVPVRVFAGNSFVDHLTLGDFEVLENGVLQSVEAVYLVKNKAVARKEENRTFSPDTSRTFFLFFIIYEYDAKLREA